MLEKLKAWVDDRLALSAVARAAVVRPMDGPARWSTALGHALLWLFILEGLTGFALANLYAPTARDAWGSIIYLERTLAVGALVRGVHYWGAQAMVVGGLVYCLSLLALSQHRAPREGAWWMSLGVFGMSLAAAHTGAMLPWDEKAFWIAKVEDGIIQGFPVIGEAAARALRNGPELGTPTLTRMYALHVALVPALFALLFAWRGFILRRHGVSSAPDGVDVGGAEGGSREGARGDSWPSQTAHDAIVAMTLTLACVVLARRFGAPLEGPADPDMADYPARPEWYLLWLFRLRKLFEGKAELVATAIIPGVGTGLLFAVPFLDRGRAQVGRFAGIATLAALAGYTAYSVSADEGDPKFRQGRDAAAVRAAAARRFAADGIAPEGPQDLLRTHPSVRPRLLYGQHCGGCHAGPLAAPRDAQGRRTNARGPALEGFGSRAWARAVMINPDAPSLFGRTQIHGMPPQRDLDANDLDNLSEYLYAQSVEPGDPAPDPAKVRNGDELFHNTCTVCHQGAGDLSETDPSARDAPDLTGWGSRAWIRGQIVAPAYPTRYGTHNEMPSFQEELSGRDLEMVVDYVRSLRARPAPVPVPPPPPAPTAAGTSAEDGGAGDAAAPSSDAG
jgi:ubiquinol-cytochrome c reductase cytochrome b subunit